MSGSINAEMIEFLGATNVAGRERGGLVNAGLEQVVRWNPEHFRHDLRHEVARFHRRFHHQEPSATQLDRVLAEPGVAPR